MSGGPGQPPDANTPLFETYFRVRFHEVDALGHVNNASYLNYLEQAAIDHAKTAGLDLARLKSLGGVFVARRHEIVFLRPTFADDLLRVVTWLGAPHGARIERRSLIIREANDPSVVSRVGQLVRAGEALDQRDPIVRAVTEWAFVNNRGEPRRIPEAAIAHFQSGAPPYEEGAEG